MTDKDILTPHATEAEQLKQKDIYIDWDFILDLYSYKERFEKSLNKEWITHTIFNKQLLEHWNIFPEKKVVLKTKEPSYFIIFDIQYLEHYFFQKKFTISAPSSIEFEKKIDKKGKINVKKINNRIPWLKTLKKYPDVDYNNDEFYVLTNKNWSTYTIPTPKWKVPYTGYTMSWDIFTLDIPSTKFIERDDIEYCNSFMRPDCVIFRSFINKPKNFYYGIFINRDTIQPWDTLSITTSE